MRGLNVSKLGRVPVTYEEEQYSRNHRQLGHCLIFNQQIFDPHTGLEERFGSDRDRDQLERLFTLLGFIVKVCDNLTVAEITTEIMDLASTDHTDCDMLAVVFMSHGGEHDSLWGRDDHIRARFLYQSFQGDACKSLAGKPKLFFIQGCREECLDDVLNRIHYLSSDNPDCLLCWSTVPGHYAWRNTTKCSWFIQSLVLILANGYKYDDLVSMLTSVNRHMIINFKTNCPCQLYLTLMNKVFLTPK